MIVQKGYFRQLRPALS